MLLSHMSPHHASVGLNPPPRSPDLLHLGLPATVCSISYHLMQYQDSVNDIEVVSRLWFYCRGTAHLGAAEETRKHPSNERKQRDSTRRNDHDHH
jgi:hypothetical protein